MRVAVIGAGLVGTCCAMHLLRGGARVTIYDPCEVERGASFGNVGSISDGSIVPLAGPGVLRQVARAMLEQDGVMKVGLGRALVAMPWLLEFLRQSRPDNVRRAAAALAPLLALAFDAYEELLGPSLFRDLFRRDGQLYLYETDADFAKDAGGRSLRREYGIRMEMLGSGAVKELEPNLIRTYAHGVFFPDAGHVVAPAELLNRLQQLFVQARGDFCAESVTEVRVSSRAKPQLRAGTGDWQEFDRVVIAAGAWSAPLVAMLGQRLPVESMRGYVVDYDAAPLRRPTFFPHDKIFATPMAFGLRVGGVADLLGVRRKADWRRSAVVAAHAKALIGRLDSPPVRRWMGHRPTTPDSVPVIGPLPGQSSVLIAAGHGQTGLMTAAITGRLVADMALGRTPEIDPASYRLNRF